MQEKTEQKPTPLKKYMEERGLRLREFARSSQIAPTTLHAIFHGYRQPKKRIASKICRATHFTITLEDFGLS